MTLVVIFAVCPSAAASEKEHRQRESSSVQDGGSASDPGNTRYSTAPWPAYKPQVLYNYRSSSNGLGLNDKDLAEMCFPNKVWQAVLGGQGHTSI